MTINNLLKEIKNKKLKVDTDLIQHAYRFADKAHQGQKRENGEKYINHPLHTALNLVRMKLDTASIASGLIHDVVNNTSITVKQIEDEFGKEIAFLVKGVTKLSKIKYQGIKRHVENLRKMFLAMSKDIRIIVIKLADRLHSVKTLEAFPKRKQKRIALETLEIYAPIAHRLGMGTIKGELEDLAFPYVYPEEYHWLKDKIKDRFKKREEYLQKVTPLIKQKLKKENINFIDVNSRAKRYYSLYRKLQRYDMDFSRIYDLLALRIIVPTIEDCYKTLGAIHKYWNPLPGRIKDYIAAPKANGYQSLHTTIFCEKGRITELQIRTPKIHWEADYGVAAHWCRHNTDKTKYYGIKKPQLEWIKELEKWQKDKLDPEEFLKSLKLDFFKYRIFVLTPKGDVINLPEGATPVDFAYRIHTELGHRCGSSKVDGKIVPLNHSLHNGQIVEILTKKEAKPNRKWLRFVKTNHAKNKIKNWFKKSTQTPDKQRASISKKKIQLKKEIIVPPPGPSGLPIQIRGGKRIAVKIAKCCNPVPGEKIIGYITSSRHVTVHHYQCRNALNKDKKRIIPVFWKNANISQPVTLEIVAQDRIGLIKNVTTALSASRINIINLNATEPTNDIALVQLSFEINNIQQLNEIEKKIKKIKGIWEVKRVHS